MKKSPFYKIAMKIRAFSIFITLLSLFNFVSCDFHNQNVKEYLEHWTNTGQIVGHSFENPYQTNSSGITCLPTDSSQTVSLELHNPQKYNLQFEYIFDEAAVQEAAETLTSPVTIDISDDRFSATAVFSREFLEKIDKEAIGGKNISGHITIFEPDSARTFDPYTIALSANTPPDEIRNPLMQLTEDGAGSYILCFYVPTYSSYSSGHKQTDTTKLYINGTQYDYNPLDGTVTGTDFSSTYSGTLHPCASNGLTFSPSAPEGYNTVYYETGEAISDAEKKFEIKLVDSYGLSYVTGASNKTKKLRTPSISVTTGSYAAAEDTGLYSITITAPTHTVRTTDPSAEDDSAPCGSGVTITYTIEQTSGEAPVFEGGTSRTLTRTALDSKTIKLPRGTYTVRATASKSYFITSSESSVTGVKITQPPVFYVAETGRDEVMPYAEINENTGASASPYRTIQKALDRFNGDITAGDYESTAICEVLVKTDLTTPDDFWTTSPEPSAIITIPAKADATVKIKGYGAVRTLTAANVPEDASYDFFEAASGSSTIVLENLKFNSGNCNTLKGISINNGKLNTATNCEFYNTNSASDDNPAVINIGSGSQLTLTNCEIHDNNIKGIYNSGTLTLTNVTIQNNTTSSDGGAIYNNGSLTLEGCTITGNKCGALDSYDGGAIYNNNDESTGFYITGSNKITGNYFADGTTPSNIYLSGSKKLQVTGSLAGSNIGVYKSTAPSIDHPVIFTDGFKTNNGSLLPGAVFTSDKGYAVALEGNEAAFAVSSGGMYLPTDFTFTFEVKDAAGNAATGMYPGVAKTFTVIPTITRKGAGETTATTIAYADIASDVTWSAALYNGGTLTSSASQPALNTTGGITVTVPAQSYVDTYTLKVTAEYLGITHDISVPLDYSYSAENAASYISTLTTSGTYNVKVTGGVGSGIDNTTDEITSTDAGLAKVAKAIRALPGGVLINLDPGETTASSTITTYNDGKYFKDCTALRSIILPDWMQYIITSLFEGCTNLTGVTLSSTTQLIAANAFKNCTHLTSVTLPEGITGSGSTHGIATGAFAGCTSLATINYEGTISQWAEVNQGSNWYSGVPASIVHCIDGDSPINPLAATPLTLEAREAGAVVTFSNKASGSVTYKVNGGSTQTIASGTSAEITLSAVGNKVQFYGDNAAYGSSSNSNSSNISCSKDCYVYGNIMSLIKSSGFENETELTASNTFAYLFYGNTKLKNKAGSALLLPATSILDRCYKLMFHGCTGLTTAPALPATTLASECYREMFYGCTSLTTAPALPATTLASECYTYMFYGCTSLTEAPALSATTLATHCYYSMFMNCTSLATAPALPATTLANYCYYSMFQGCTSLTTAPALPATTLASYCYCSMFQGCTSLTNAPVLPATTMTEYCYANMFNGCTTLTTAPAIPATALANYCYYAMFDGCTSLTTAPALPATTLADSCYREMFSGCTSLTAAPELSATTLVSACYEAMFFGCTNLSSVTCLATDISVSGCTSNWLSGVASTGTFTKAPGMNDWTSGTSGIPSGWTIHESGFQAENLTTANYASVTEIAVSSAEGMTNLITLANSTNAKTFEGKTITLEADVELSAGEYFATDFKGTFDGNGKKISGLSGVTALFNKLAGGTVKNLTVEGSSTNGGIVSSANSGLIEGCTSRVNVTSTGTSDIGGITGFMSSSTVKNCINYGTITGSGDGLGGIVGYMQGSDVIDSCINRGNIQSTANKTGGIVGSAFGLVRNCINIGEVSGTTNVGGIAGKENCGASTPNGVYNCANLAAVTANYRAGGIAGVCDISTSSTNYNAIVKNCFNAGSVTRTDTSKESAGGIVGEILTGGSGTCTLTSNYYLPGTAAMGGIGVTNSASVTSPSQSTPSVSEMNTWVNENNSGNVYKTWTTKTMDDGTSLPVPDVGYEW